MGCMGMLFALKYLIYHLGLESREKLNFVLFNVCHYTNIFDRDFLLSNTSLVKDSISHMLCPATSSNSLVCGMWRHRADTQRVSCVSGHNVRPALTASRPTM